MPSIKLFKDSKGCRLKAADTRHENAGAAAAMQVPVIEAEKLTGLILLT
jgi:hypothetical protein